jgi:hypothetical protein
MRTLLIIGCLALCTNVYARDRKKNTAHAPSPSNVAVVEDEPMSKDAAHATPAGTLDTGSHRDIHMAAPTVKDVGATQGTLVERGAGEDPAQARANDFKPVSGVTEELAARQMRKYQGAIDACVADAKKRAPNAAGTLTLTVLVGERKVSFADVEGNYNDAALDKCLVSSAEKWTFSLSHASFHHVVVLAPAAAPLASR